MKILENGYSTVTDAFGNYDFKSIGPIYVGTYTLIVTAQNYGSKVASNITITEDSQEILLNVSLLKQYGSIRGYLYEERNGIEGYQVGSDLALSDKVVEYIVDDAAAGTASQSVNTDSNGYYEITNLPIGRYNVTYGATPPPDEEGEVPVLTHSSITQAVDVADQQIVEKNVALAPIYAKVSGHVLEDKNGNDVKDSDEQYLSSITVNQSGADDENAATTDGTGFYSINTSSGTIIITATASSSDAEGGGATSSSKYYDRQIVVTTTAGQETTLDIPLVPIIGTISGKVIDKNTNEPISGAKVLILGTNYNTLTNSEGEFTLENIPIITDTATESYKIIVDYISGGYALAEDVDAISYPTSSMTNYRLDNPIKLAPLNRPVNGRVVSSRTLEGIYDATVSVALYDGTSTSVKTDTQGYFSFSSVPVKTYEDYSMTVYHDEYETKLISFYLGAGNSAYTITPDITLDSINGEISGRVIDRDTNWPFQHETVTITATLDVHGKTTNVTVDNDGYYKFENVKAGGPYKITFSPSTGSNTYFNDKV